MKSQLDQLMRRAGLDLLWASGPSFESPDVYYLCGGVSLTAAWVMLRPGKTPVLAYGPMEREAAAASGLEIVDFNELGQAELAKRINDPLELAVETFIRLAEREGLAGRMAVHGISDPGDSYHLLNAIQDRLPQIEVVRDEPPVLGTARATKDEAELELMRGVATDTVACLDGIFALLRSCRDKGGELVDENDEPMTVGRVKSRLRELLAARNLQETHETILGQGREAGIPHASTDEDAVLRTGTATVLDVFPRRGGGGYYFDITRSFTIGRPDAEFQRLYDTVYDAQRAAIERAAEGMDGDELQRLVCDRFEAAGHPTQQSDPGTSAGYVHSLGHGIGLEIHEGPRLRLQEEPDERNRLRTGSVFTVEPGLYYPDRELGVRIEDVVYIGENGRAEILAPFDKFSVLELEG